MTITLFCLLGFILMVDSISPSKFTTAESKHYVLCCFPLSPGISTYKVVTVHHPPNGYAHATIGWAGIWGSITGISAQGEWMLVLSFVFFWAGVPILSLLPTWNCFAFTIEFQLHIIHTGITAHEANLESNDITFRGTCICMFCTHVLFCDWRAVKFVFFHQNHFTKCKIWCEMQSNSLFRAQL